MRKILLFGATVLLSACVTTGWNAKNHIDEFTGSKMCRVEKGTKGQRDFARGFTGTYFTQHFYAENHNGEIRAGVRTEPPLPIGGDIQIKVGEKLYVLTSQDTPIDVAPSVPVNTAVAEKAMGKAYANTMEAIVKNSQQLSSPYRALTGSRAKTLLRDIANTSSEIKFRVVGVNSVASGVGSFTAGEEFSEVLQQCGIHL